VGACIITLEDRDHVAGELVLNYRALSKDDPVVLDEDRYDNYIAGETSLTFPCETTEKTYETLERSVVSRCVALCRPGTAATCDH
jgi:hypothetical protein